MIAYSYVQMINGNQMITNESLPIIHDTLFLIGILSKHFGS